MTATRSDRMPALSTIPGGDIVDCSVAFVDRKAWRSLRGAEKLSNSPTLRRIAIIRPTRFRSDDRSGLVLPVCEVNVRNCSEQVGVVRHFSVADLIVCCLLAKVISPMVGAGGVAALLGGK